MGKPPKWIDEHFVSTYLIYDGKQGKSVSCRKCGWQGELEQARVHAKEHKVRISHIPEDR